MLIHAHAVYGVPHHWIAESTYFLVAGSKSSVGINASAAVYPTGKADM
jgi:hypothetical protein